MIPAGEKSEFSQILYSSVTTHGRAYISFWISPWLWLMIVSKFPDSNMIPRRIKRILLQPVKNEMLFVMRTLALVPSNPSGPMTWSVRSLLLWFNVSSKPTCHKYDVQREHQQQPSHRPTIPNPRVHKQHGQEQRELVDHHSTISPQVNTFQVALSALRTVIPFSPTSVISPSDIRAKSGLSAQAADLMM